MKTKLPLLLIACMLCLGAFAQKEKGSTPVSSTEFRGVWLHSTFFDKKADIARAQIVKLFDSYQEIGINNLFCYYTLPEENGLDWDYLQVLIDEGHKRGIRIHPTFCPGHETASIGEIKDHPEWLIVNRDGTKFNALNLTRADVRDFWKRQIREVMKYDIDGIHLDYMRFPVNQQFSYDSLTISLFRKEYGRSPLDDSQDDGSILWCEWINWNGRQITGLLREIRELVNQSGKKILLGADVFPNPETSKVLIGQDWASWAQTDLLDFICPMFYTNNLDLFREYTDRAVKITKKGMGVYPGVGVGTSHNKITKDLLVKEVQITRDAGTGGVIFFSGFSFDSGMSDTLKTTLFRK
ncbi:MAG: family 10 glycosylhydrolase [Bacteroidales bacterium]|nr:family 10 glycosylhydrolase [Bacteroidales bacterium]